MFESSWTPTERAGLAAIRRNAHDGLTSKSDWFLIKMCYARVVYMYGMIIEHAGVCALNLKCHTGVP